MAQTVPNLPAGKYDVAANAAGKAIAEINRDTTNNPEWQDNER